MRGKILIGLIFVLAACGDDSIISVQQQLQKDIKAIDDYLVANNITNVIKDASGVRLVITTLGTAGLPPNLGNDLKIVYAGRLLGGPEFDSGTLYEKLGNYIFGWQIALQLLPEGSEATIYIPSSYAYGSQGNSSIPPNTNLVFDVFLESVVSTTGQLSKLASDGVIIDNYLASKGAVTAITHSSGLRYEILAEGNVDGATPGVYDQIKVTYTGKLIPAETDFGAGTVEPNAATSSRVVNFVHGWQIGLPLLKEGGKIRLYVPSGLAYGNIVQDNIPANSNLFFEIELIDIIE